MLSQDALTMVRAMTSTQLIQLIDQLAELGETRTATLLAGALPRRFPEREILAYVGSMTAAGRRIIGAVIPLPLEMREEGAV